MPRKYLDHLFSVLFIVLLFLILFLIVRSGAEAELETEYTRVAPYLNLASLDLSEPLHRTLFSETLNIYYPETEARNDSLVELTRRYATDDFMAVQEMLRSGPGLTWSKFWSLSGMYISFIISYLLVMVLTYYGVQTLAVLRFVKEKQNLRPYLIRFVEHIQQLPPRDDKSAIAAYLQTGSKYLGLAILKGIGYLILFSPAYVLAYSFRSRFDTDTFVFMILLGAVSNGLLVMYAQRFFTFLTSESRKGYVQTAIVKNLNAAYSEIPWSTLFRFRKRFDDHILQHIYLNARYQYILTLKEQASFLITGLIIIEMALNIHGHICYELLQNVLFEQYDVVLIILLGLFLVVKATEVLVDLWMDLEAMKYENR
ncbi:MAG: hypothetical protein HOH43_19310 [Candidatus Latescibacteria bacterium]|nr:hypothetical protein [Candidatus Latescibacterota bacterium]